MGGERRNSDDFGSVFDADEDTYSYDVDVDGVAQS
jgi:hypothetical protein